MKFYIVKGHGAAQILYAVAATDEVEAQQKAGAAAGAARGFPLGEGLPTSAMVEVTETTPLILTGRIGYVG